MKTKCTSDNRELILQILQNETGFPPVFSPLPDFSVNVGGYTLLRDGFIETDLADPSALKVLASVGLCDYSAETAMDDEPGFIYPMEGHSGTSLMNLICIISARQYLINRVIGARGAFFVSRQLMSDLLAHSPSTAAEFLQALYGRGSEYEGLRFTMKNIIISGFCKGKPGESGIHRQLSDLLVSFALSRRWTKPFTPRVRNQKYTFRTWINSIGMTGPEYEEARAVFLSRLPGRTDRRKLSAARRSV